MYGTEQLLFWTHFTPRVTTLDGLGAWLNELSGVDQGLPCCSQPAPSPQSAAPLFLVQGWEKPSGKSFLETRSLPSTASSPIVWGSEEVSRTG